MQRFLVSISKGMERFLYNLERVLTAGIFILTLGCITTYLHHTAYRQIWQLFITILVFGCIGGALFSLVEFALVESIHPENMGAAFSFGQIVRQKERWKKRGKVLGFMLIASILIGRLMVGGYSQTFTGDPWWVTVEQAQLVAGVPFMFCRSLREMTWDSILKARKKK